MIADDQDFEAELDAFIATLDELDPRANRTPVTLVGAPPRVARFWSRVGWRKVYERLGVFHPDTSLGDARIARALQQWPLAKKRHHEVIDALPRAHRLALDLGLGFWVSDEDRGAADPPLVHIHTEYPTYRLRVVDLGASYLAYCASIIASSAFRAKGWVSAPLWFDPLPHGRTPAPMLVPGLRTISDVWLSPIRPGSQGTIRGWAVARSHASIARLLLERNESPIGVVTPIGLPNVRSLPRDALAHAARTFETRVLEPGMGSAQITTNWVLEIDGVPCWVQRYEQWVDKTAFRIEVDDAHVDRIAGWVSRNGGVMQTTRST